MTWLLLRKTEEWALIHRDLKTLNYAIGTIREDLHLLNEKNNHRREEIDNVSSEQKTLFKIVGCLETHIDELETTIDTQKHDIARLKRNVATLDQNTCCCQDCLLSPEPHGLMDEEGLEYLTHWGQGVVSWASTLQIHHKEMDKVQANTHPAYPKFIQNFPSQFSCNFPSTGNGQFI